MENTIKWKDEINSYELEVKNVGMKNDYPIQMVLQKFNGKRNQIFCVDIPRDKVKEFLDKINKENN